MKIYKININSTINYQLFHLAVGNFDGVHIGHQMIISQLVNNAKKNGKPSAILSFDPHPRQYFSKNVKHHQIISNKNKQFIFDDLGVDYYFSLFFNEEIANLSATDFVLKIIVKQLKVEHLVVGYDFRFGKDREGDIDFLKNHASIHGFKLNIIEPVYNKVSDIVYSSTLIRKFIHEGKVENAKLMLGRNWTMEGNVIIGSKKAREMNFPTANIQPHSQILPLKGVYSIQTMIDNKLYKGIANFGARPTVKGKKLLLEVHIFDFNTNIYGKHLTVEFLTFIREERKFESFELLAEQIKKDIQIAKKHHKKNHLAK